MTSKHFILYVAIGINCCCYKGKGHLFVFDERKDGAYRRLDPLERGELVVRVPAVASCCCFFSFFLLSNGCGESIRQGAARPVLDKAKEGWATKRPVRASAEKEMTGVNTKRRRGGTIGYHNRVDLPPEGGEGRRKTQSRSKLLETRGRS